MRVTSRTIWLVASTCLAVLMATAPAVAQQSSTQGASSSSESAETESTDEPRGGSSEAPTTPGSEGIDIDVSGKAKRTLTPMAIPDTLTPAGSNDVAAEVESQLRRSLRLSGFFKILPNDSFFFDPSEEGMGTTDINFQDWFNVGAQALIKSAVRVEGDEVDLDLRLYEVDSGTRVNLDWDGGRAKKGEVAGQVDSFVNAVLKHFTGTTGPFGTRITYVKRNENGLKQIFTAQMDGSNRRQITDNGAINLLPSWGGDSVYYTSYRDQNPDLWRWNNGEHSKVSSRSGQNSGAAWCDGQVAVTLSMGGQNADIYLIDPTSGKVQKRLTDSWAIDTSPTWSPDCSKLAFVSGRAGSPQIYVMNADGSGVRRLTFEGTYNTSPNWSPKGEEIAFTARDRFNRFDIFLVNLEGDLTRLTQDQGNNETPSFGPNGRYIVFSSDRGGQGNRLWLMTADGEVQEPITPDGSGFTDPDWQH